MLSSVKFNDHSYWVSVFEPLPHERDELFEKYEVTSDLLDYAIDPYEKARIEIDRDAGITLLIFDVYIPNHEESAPPNRPGRDHANRKKRVDFYQPPHKLR